MRSNISQLDHEGRRVMIDSVKLFSFFLDQSYHRLVEKQVEKI